MSSKQLFSIRDLENLTGIKAHTIRTWEKRYNILTPSRDQNNVRSYSGTNLRELMNIKLLNNHGYKISKIAQLPDGQIPRLVAEITNDKSIKSHSLNAFLLSMMDFDVPLFVATYRRLAATKSFREIYHEVFLPLLAETGELWQSGTITAAHEHFISELVRQKTAAEADRMLPPAQTDDCPTVVLFLPMGETHDTALRYMYYEVLAHGCRPIYLGPNVVLEDLAELGRLHDHLIFATYLTQSPGLGELPQFLSAFSQKVLRPAEARLWIAGRLATEFRPSPKYPEVTALGSLAEFIEKLEDLTQKKSA